MSNKVMLDSSVLIEYVKESRPELLEALLKDKNLNLCYCMPVVNEYLFHYLAILGQKAPLTIKVNQDIGNILSDRRPLDIFIPLSFVTDAEEVSEIAFDKMKKYNLLPSDAVILALCIFHDIKCLASFDSDFLVACMTENIMLVQSVKDLGNIS